MRSLHRVLGLLFVVVPGLAASCSGDATSSNAANGGEGLGGEGAMGGEPTSGGKSNGNAGSSADAGDGGKANTLGGQAGEGAATQGNGGEGGAGETGSNGGEGGMNGNAGEPGANGGASGAGGEAGGPGTPGPVIVFDAGPHNGLNFGGRLGLDQHCATAKLAQTIAGAKTHALISVSAADELRDMPALYGVPTNVAFESKSGQKIADNWADLLDGSIDQSLTGAGISSAQFWISGSNTDGSVRSTCNGWTTSEFNQQVTGSYGYPTSTDSLWITITDGDVYCSASQYNVICLAYD